MIKRIFVWSFIISIFAGLFLLLGRSGRDIVVLPWRDVNFLFIFLALSIYLTASLSFYLLWAQIYFALGKKVSGRKSFKVWAYSLLGKYSLLGIGQPLSRVYLATQLGLQKEATVGSVILEQEMIVMGAILYAGAGIIMGKHYINFYILSLSFVIILFLSQPRLWEKFSNFFLRLRRRPPISIKISSRQIIIWVVKYFIVWLIVGAAFFLYLNGLGIKGEENFFSVGVILAVSFLSGYLAPFVPAGLGVREATMSFLISKNLGVDISLAIAAALLFRLLILLGELLCLCVARVI